ncbi:HNH endonuclease [Patescibacteria group bacterium]|nr:HNH endonuclease [Patescibacteria group bacterium]
MDNRNSTQIISYLELVIKEKAHLQKGMNFRKDSRPSVFLMSVKDNAPYADVWDEEKQILIYEGHDVYGAGDKRKEIDQPMYSSGSTLTDNGKFFRESERYKNSERTTPLEIQVYEKLMPGIWYDKGLFELLNAEIIVRGNRKVFTFHLHPKQVSAQNPDKIFEYTHERMIPAHVKVEVWKRDGGKCTTCGAGDGLHYDHVLPYSKGGRSDDAKNIQLLCARHNLEKGAKIM